MRMGMGDRRGFEDKSASNREKCNFKLFVLGGKCDMHL
jgi:hypothetical protein